jgi:hypothetical protein
MKIRWCVLGAALALVPACRPSAPVARVRISPATVRLGYPESALVHFEWSPVSALDGAAGAPTVFVHLLDAGGAVKRTFDHPFPPPWSPGAPVSYDLELYQSALGAPLAAGTYRMTAGLYDPGSGRRWPLDVGSTGGRELGRHEYSLGAVEVPRTDVGTGAAAAFAFSGEWGPPEPDPSVQVLARRRILGPSELRFAGRAGVPGALRLALTVHGAPITVESDCASGVARTQRLEAGYHWVGFGLPASGVCSVRFPDVTSRANAPPDTLGAVARRAAETASSLDVAAWRPAR